MDEKYRNLVDALCIAFVTRNDTSISEKPGVHSAESLIGEHAFSILNRYKAIYDLDAARRQLADAKRRAEQFGIVSSVKGE